MKALTELELAFLRQIAASNEPIYVSDNDPRRHALYDQGLIVGYYVGYVDWYGQHCVATAEGKVRAGV